MAERHLTLVSTQAPTAASRESIRLLGRQLGEVIREQHGQAAFDRVENLRRHVVNEHRQGRSAVPQIRQLSHLPNRDLTLLIRAFAIFSQLANIADDYDARCKADSDEETPLDRLKKNSKITPEQVYAYLENALIAPVITAHPTEVRRKSVIDRESAIADLLPAYHHHAASKAKREEIETQLKREIRTLWQTRMLRPERIKVIDEIDNAMSFMARTFMTQLPVVKHKLARIFGLQGPLPPAFRVGSWVGGDRDGNPFVTAATLDYSVKHLAEIAFDYYLEEIYKLGGELSLSDELVPVSKALAALAASGPHTSVHKADEPYRQALAASYARLSATRKQLLGRAAVRLTRRDGEAYASARQLADDLTIIADSLVHNGSADLADGRLTELREAVETFGFHLAAMDLRQNAAVHERVIAELFREACVNGQYEKLP